MSRSRIIKPAFFENEILGTVDPLIGLTYIGLWTLADRKGILEDRPLRIKAKIFPYRELPLFNGYLTQLQQLGFIERYEEAGLRLIWVKKFLVHQSPHSTEKASIFPEYNPETSITVKERLSNRELTEQERSLYCIPYTVSDTVCGIPDVPPAEPPAPKPKKSAFQKPTLEEMKSYGIEIHLCSTECEKCFDYYEANGWRVGKNPMRDWKAAMRNWKKNENQYGENHGNGNQQTGRRVFKIPDENSDAQRRAILEGAKTR